MKIKLDQEFFIEVDSLNHTLKQKYKGETRDGSSKEAEKVIGYFQDVEQCVERYLDERQKLVSTDKAMTMREYVNLVKKSNSDAIKAIKSLLGVKENDSEGS